VQFLHAVDQAHHQLVDALETLPLSRTLFADLEDLALGVVEHGGYGAPLRVEGAGGDIVAGGDELAQDRSLAHDLGIAPHIGRAGHALRQRIQVGQAAAVLRLAQALQLLEDGDHIGRLALRHQRADGGVDQPVFVAIEVAVGEQVAGAVPGQVVEQQAAEHALLGFHRMGRHAQARDLLVARRGAGFTGVVDR
jgi:hypothetical protein